MFHFRLDAVHKIRLNEEEKAQLALAKEITILQNHQLRLKDYHSQRQAMLATLDQKKEDSINGALMRLYMDSIRAKELQSKILSTTIASQNQIVTRARQQLTEAVKERKIIEAIRKRDLHQYQQELLRKEQTESDEMAVLRYKNETSP